MSLFSEYSVYYDLLYKDKDYGAESNYVFDAVSKNNKVTKSLLELGCGTGKHAEHFLKKIELYSGVDMSIEMITQAKERLKTQKVNFEVGDARTYRSNQVFDTVVSLFHVASYQIENEDFNNFLKTANHHLKSGSTFLFDFWYGPAVLNLKPSVKIKRMENKEYSIIRIAEPLQDYQKNLVTVDYEVIIQNIGNKKETRLKESHPMRYFFLPELKHFLEVSGFDLAETRFEEWITGKEPNENTWGVTCITRKR